MPQVKIGPEFFEKAKQDYCDWKWAIAREFMQNCIDCGSDAIEISVAENDPGSVIMTVSNNGEPMTRSILEEKLLSLGSSGKDFAGAVGGFGKAKEILYFCHRRYGITTGDMRVMGSGAQYNIEKTGQFLHGTRSVIIIPTVSPKELVAVLELEVGVFAEMCQWGGKLTLNGVELKTDLKRGSKRRDFSWCTVYTNNSMKRKMVVRMNGMPMFTRHVNVEKCVVIELKHDSGTCLTSNRDELKREFNGELNDFFAEISVDTLSALRKKSPEYWVIGTKKIKVPRQSKIANINAAYATNPTASKGISPAHKMIMDIADSASAEIGKATKTEVEDGSEQRQFVVKNTTSMEIPDWFMPGEKFSSYSEKLVVVWVQCLMQIHSLFGDEQEFSTGFIFDEDCEAQHEVGKFGHVYYINPAVIVKQADSNSRSLKKRWKYTPAGYNMLLACAVHEYAHSLGFSWHDESYANKLTDLFGMVLANRTKFNHCFK